MRLWHWSLGLDKRSFLFQAARLEKQSGVKRVESEHHRSPETNASLALIPGFG